MLESVGLNFLYFFKVWIFLQITQFQLDSSIFENLTQGMIFDKIQFW